MSLQLPIDSTDEHSGFTVELDGQTYGLDFRWNKEADAWFISLSDAEGEVISTGQRLVPDWPLFGRVVDSRMFPGILMGQDSTGAHADPDRNDLGSRFLLLYFPFDELFRGGLMPVLYQRVCQLTVDGLQMSGFKCVFKVKKTSGKEPNELEATVYNLTEDHRARMRKKGAAVIFEAGYATGGLVKLFSGDARFIEHTHEGADWLTKIQCADGERAYNYKPVVASFKAGTSVADVFKHVAESTGLDVTDAVRTVQDLLGSTQFLQGYSAFGKAPVILDKLLNGRGLEWSIQNGRLQVLPVGKPLTGRAVLLSPSTGLVGSPSHGSPVHASASGKPSSKKQTLKVKSLLNGRIAPGVQIRVESRAINGAFKVQDVVHSGDPMGADWYSDIEALPFE